MSMGWGQLVGKRSVSVEPLQIQQTDFREVILHTQTELS